jgi:hypothetical protein
MNGKSKPTASKRFYAIKTRTEVQTSTEHIPVPTRATEFCRVLFQTISFK